MAKMGKAIDCGDTKSALWAKRIEQWRDSGHSQREFCARQGWPLSSFQWWRARLKRAEASRAQSLFVPLVLDGGQSGAISVIEVQLRSGTRVRFEGEAARAAVAALVSRVR